MKRILSIILSIVMLISLLPTTALALETTAVQIPYLDANGTKQVWANPTKITDQTMLTSGCYYVEDAVTISSRINVSGNVHLILCDGATLTANKGIAVVSGNSLTIYGQENGTGELTANAGDNNAAIGGTNGTCGNITINGGVITAAGGEFGAGIGGGFAGRGEVTINGGVVTAAGGKSAAGIGGGSRGGCTVTINGGVVTATGGGYSTTNINEDDGAGIGGGVLGSNIFVAINGGTVTASNNGAAGIGYGNGGSGSMTVTINGGSVKASGISHSDVMPQNAANERLSQVTVTVPTDKTVDDLIVGTDYTYGKRDMEPDTDGKLYLWLPDGVSVGFETIPYPLWVGGVQLTSANLTVDNTDNSSISGSATYDPDTNTLTLDDFTYTGAGYNNAAIYYSDDSALRLVLKGDSSVTHTGGANSYGVWTNNDAVFSISGSGSLTANGGAAASGNSYGIYTYSSGLDISGSVNVRATGGTASNMSAGIRNMSAASISENATVTAVGGASNSASIGFANNEGNLAMSGNGKLYATAGKGGWSDGIQAGYQVAVSDNGIVEGIGGEAVTFSRGICTTNLVVYGGSVKAAAGTITDASGDNYGVRAKLQISGGSVIAQGGMGAFGVQPEVGENYTSLAMWCGETETAAMAAGAKDISALTDSYGQKYVKLAPGCTVTFEENGGSEVMDQVFACGSKVVAPADPIKTGCTFAGWYRDSAQTIAWDFENDTVIGNTTLYAKWTPNEYTLHYDGNGGYVLGSDKLPNLITSKGVSLPYGYPQYLPEATFVRPGYTLIGWNTAADGSGDWWNENLTVVGNVTYYAQWELNISLDADSGVYNGQSHAPVVTIEGLNAETDFTVTYPEDMISAGEKVITITFNDNTTTSVKYAVTPKTLTITADDKAAYVGSRQPELTCTVTGLVGGDMLTAVPTLSTDANMYRVGAYTIIPSGADAGDNYSITYVNGTLTVKDYPYIPIISSDPTYPPVVDNSENGDVSVSPKNPEKGDTVIIIPDPDDGYEVDNVIVTDKNGNPVEVIDNGDGTYSFVQPNGKVNIKVTFEEIACPGDSSCPMYPYTDLDRTLWYHDGIHFCIEKNLMQGVGGNQFDPNGTTTRAMIVTILWRLEGSPAVNYAMDFEDVETGKWYTEAIRWAASEKIVEGYGNGKFGTNDAITREQMATILYRYEQSKGGGFTGMWMYHMDFADLADVSEWAYEAMCWMNMNEVITGKPGNVLDPRGGATRAEAAAMLQRYCEIAADD